MKLTLKNTALLAAGTLALLFMLALSGCAGSSANNTGSAINGANPSSAGSNQTTAQNTHPAQTIAAGQNLTINIKDLSSQAQFYPVTVDGTKMEVLALKDSQGNVRTAFNTCQVCYSSGKGYYVQEGDKLVCQNCGNQFGVDQVEIQSGGCNPVPIFDNAKTTSATEVTIPYATLQQAKATFANWKN